MHSANSRRLAYAVATFGSSVLLAGAIAFAAFVARADPGARRPDVRFPYVIELDADHRFFLYGEELAGPLRFELDAGALRVNARALFPPPAAPARPAREQPEGALRTAFGNVPLVSECVARGGTWSDCVRAFTARQDSMTRRIGRRWRELGDARGAAAPGNDRAADEPAAVRARSDSALVWLDPAVVGEIEAARAQSSIDAHGVLRFPVPGSAIGLVTIDVDSPFGATRAVPESLTVAAAAARVMQVARFLTHRRPAIYVVSRGGDAAATGARAREFLAEIDAVKADPNFQPKRLSGGQADEFRAFAAR